MKIPVNLNILFDKTFSNEGIEKIIDFINKKHYFNKNSYHFDCENTSDLINLINDEINFSGYDFYASDTNYMNEIKLKEINKINFFNNIFNNIQIINTKFINCNFSNCDINKCKFIDCHFIDCIFDNANIEEILFQGTCFEGINFIKSFGKNIEFNTCVFLKCHLNKEEICESLDICFPSSVFI